MERRSASEGRREYDLSKQVSLVVHDPGALVALKSTGSCEVELSEELFDANYPGHFFRRIRSVAIEIPGVAGAYTSVTCTLTLLSSRVRISDDAGARYREQPPDPRFRYESDVVQSVATSSAQSDSGVFELDFADGGYLPFEGAGAVSRWRIDLPKRRNAFDFETISDVVLKLDYTAREGGDLLRKAAREKRG